MKKLIAILMVLFVICGYAFAEGTISEPREFTVEQQAFDAYLDIAFVYDEGVKYLEELGVLWSKVTDTDSVDDIHQLWFNTYLTGNISGTGFSRFSNLNELATVKYGYKGAEELSSYLNGLRDKTDAIWICLSILVESGYIEDPNDLESYLDDAMEGIRSVMTLDREYPFLKDLQNYYKDANYLYEYAADFNDSYVSFNEKLDEFQKNRSSWEIDFEFIYDKNADEFDYVYEVRREEAAHERELVFARASALENNGDLEGALDLYWSIHSTEDVERCRSKLNEATSDEMEKNYLRAVAFEESGKYQDAINMFKEIEDYKDSKAHIDACYCKMAKLDSIVYTWYDGDKITTTVTELYSYDNQGFVSKVERIGNDGEIVWIKEYTVDDNGHIINSITTGDRSSSITTVTYESTTEYDEHGNPVDETTVYKASNNESYYKDGQIETEKWNYTYDKNGNIIVSEVYYNGASQPTVYKYEYTYDNNRVVLTTVRTIDRGTPKYYSYSYDSHGLLMEVKEETRLDNQYNIASYTYSNMDN